MIGKADIVRAQGVDGPRGRPEDDALCAYAPRPEDARLVAEAFSLDDPAALRPGVDVPPPPAGRIERNGSQLSRMSVSQASTSLR